MANYIDDVPDIYTYSDDESTVPRRDEGIRRLTSAELRTSPTDLYDERADWNLGAWRNRGHGLGRGRRGRGGSYIRTPRASDSLGSGHTTAREYSYDTDVFDGRKCRVEIAGFTKASSDDGKGSSDDGKAPKSGRFEQTFAAKYFAEQFLRNFASSHDIDITKLNMDAVCSGAGDVRVVYSDDAGHVILIRAL